jgi:SAM-dependent methyltransferase
VPARSRRTDPAVRGFDRAAETYERARPDYPAAAVRHLGRVLHLGPGRIVVDLGSGTGKFTRALAPLGATRVAVEPTPGMRRVFRRAVPDVALIDGTAEAIPLPDGFADAVVCAQAFHWFRPRPALREIARVVRPGGGLGLVWNTRDDRLPWSRQISRIIGRYRRGTPEHRAQRWRPAFRGRGSPFGPLHAARFAHAQAGPPEMFVDRFLSVSVIANLPPAERRGVAAEIRELLRTDRATRGRRRITLPYETQVFWSYRR